jgi:hypothetical protein
MRKIVSIIIVLISGFSCISVQAQSSVKDSSIHMGLIQVTYGGVSPRGDMAVRFGYTSLLGLEGGIKLRNGLSAISGCQYMFGAPVREFPIPASFFTDLGFMIGERGQPVGYKIQQRGIAIPLRFGYTFSNLRIPGNNPNSGPYLELGAQYLWHRIYIETNDDLPYMSDEMRRGYDRLTSGLGVVGAIGYRFFANNRFTNFSVALEYGLHFTRGHREVNYDTGLPGNEARRDGLLGFRVAWILPLYNASPDDYYLY